MNTTNINIVFGIVCFREKFWETKSFQSLVESYKKLETKDILNIVVFDNTDFNDWDIEKSYNLDNHFINIKYFHDKRNPGIAKAINYFVQYTNEKKIEWVMFLDQDTILPFDIVEKSKDCVSRLLADGNYIAFPKVYSDGKMISPTRYIYYRTKPIDISKKRQLQLRQLTAINSGILINVDFFISSGGYNQDLRVDFCDHEFIERLNNRGWEANILEVKFVQNFSAETDSLEKSIFRYKIYLKDMYVYRRGKNQILFFLRVDFAHLLKLTYKYKSFSFIKIRLRGR